LEVPQALLCQCRWGGVEWRGRIQIGDPSEQNGQVEQDNPGKQTEGQTEGETPAPACAGKQLTHPKLRFAIAESNALA
jgi:hypothetical protein